ncbi:head-tail adaptor protein [Shinella sp.]|uniref:head-tail adaptor protein n=1 Tax=Shinella sp. TaxID=1870904 RepID=UPI0039E2C56F
MVKRSGAGSLDHRVTFQEKDLVDDGYGNSEMAWVDRFTMSARLQPLFTSKLDVEGVSQARLQSQQPYNLIVRSCADTRGITPNWRVYDARAGKDEEGEPRRFFAIKTIVDPDERRQYLEMLIVQGLAG